MSESDLDPSLSRELSRLVGTLESLQRELEPGDRRRLRPPTPRELRRFTSDVTIPALILVLETNVRALKLLQRALRVPDDAPGGSGSGVDAVRTRATGVSREALARLDDVLADVGDAIEGEPTDTEARELLETARDLQAVVDQRLAELSEAERDQDGTGEGDGVESPPDVARSETVPVDVESELQSIKDRLDDRDEDGDDDDPSEDDH